MLACPPDRLCHRRARLSPGQAARFVPDRRCGDGRAREWRGL